MKGGGGARIRGKVGEKEKRVHVDLYTWRHMTIPFAT